MGVAKKTRKFAAVKRTIGKRHAALKENKAKAIQPASSNPNKDEVIRAIPQVSSSLFFQYNAALKPPYSVLVDVCISIIEKELDQH
jgi:U3 small nucleolar RNA-associated protein 24